MSEVEGKDRLMETAQRIVTSLGTSKSMTDDMLTILSTFDNRFSVLTSDHSDHSISSARLVAAERIILRWDTDDSTSVFLPFDEDSSRDVAMEYISAVDDIMALTEYDADTVRDKAEILQQIAMARLEDELEYLLMRSALPLDAEKIYESIWRWSSSGSFTTDLTTAESDSPSSKEKLPWIDSSNLSEGITLIRPESIQYLRLIAARMIRSQYEKECIQVYTNARRYSLDDYLSVLGINRVSIGEVQRLDWQTLDDKIKKWTQSVTLIVKIVLYAEKQLCDCVFGADDSNSNSHPKIKTLCFNETAKICIKQLLNFGRAVAIRHIPPEKLFRILDMYSLLSDVMSDLQTLFQDEGGGGSTNPLCSEASVTLQELGDAVKCSFAEFENGIKRDHSSRRLLLIGGGIHPLTLFVMNFVKLAVFDYSRSLNLLLDGGDGGRVEDSDCIGGNRCPWSGSPLGNRLRLLISYLQSNLEEKSNLYEDGGLKYIFLMNNILYITREVKDSDLRVTLGDDWTRSLRVLTRQYSHYYLRASWKGILGCLSDKGVAGGGGSVSKSAVKEKFKNFNLAFEDIIKIQRYWKVPDTQLRDELRIRVSETVIPAYRSFVGRFAFHLESGRHSTRCIKYSPDHLEALITDLFEGSGWTSFNVRRKLHGY